MEDLKFRRTNMRRDNVILHKRGAQAHKKTSRVQSSGEKVCEGFKWKNQSVKLFLKELADEI
jgi:hypothetical protein